MNVALLKLLFDVALPMLLLLRTISYCSGKECAFSSRAATRHRPPLALLASPASDACSQNGFCRFSSLALLSGQAKRERENVSGNVIKRLENGLVASGSNPLSELLKSIEHLKVNKNSASRLE